MTRGRLWMVVVAVAVIGVGSLGGVNLSGRLAPAQRTASNSNTLATSLATIVRRRLTAQLAVSGTLGYSGSYIVLNEAQGYYTSLPLTGQMIGEGEALYYVDGAPVVLLYGSIPAYRALQEGETGADVAQLNANLVALSLATSAQINPSSTFFGGSTTYAVKRLQSRIGLTQTGSLGFGSVIFLPGAIRVISVQPQLGAPTQPAQLGAPAQPGQAVAMATSTARHVVVQMNAAQQSSVKVGDSVDITLPNNQTTAGTVTYVGTVATPPSGSGNGPNSQPTVEVDITPTDAAATGTLDAAPVEVYVTTASVDDALAVPVTSLLATAGGGYDVEVVDGTGRHHLVPVTLGLFDDADGLVQVTSNGLAAGALVVVAGT